jgi:AAA family ATP:ADP antiporter
MTNKVFGTVRAFLWPVHREEHKKFIPMFLMAFLICLNYYILRTTKESLVVTAPSSGAEAIPFLKLWAILPMAVLMTFIFTRFSNSLGRQKVFYAMMWFYIAYFVFFTLFLYPYRDSLHPSEFADKLQTMLPEGCRGLIAIIRNWTYTTYYIMAEMWSTMIMTVLFWGFANDVTSVKDAKRFYGLFALGTNFSGVIAGLIVPALSRHVFDASLPFGKTGWDQALTFINLIIIVTSLGCIALYWWLNSKGLGYTEETLVAHKETPKMGIRKNFSYLAKSPYLMWIAVLVVTYNIVINLVEVVWKDQVKQLYPTAADYSAFMGGVTFWIGVIATIICLVISGNVMRHLSWTKSALIAPIITLVTGVLFFAAILFPENSLAGITSFFGTTPLMMAVFLGSLQNCLVRGTKYSLVDTTKELAFIPLSQESKVKGKTAIDGVGSRLGKSGGSLVQQCLLIAFGSILGTTPVIAFFFLLALGGWIASVRVIGKQFQQLTAEHQTIVVPDEEKEEMATT